MGWNTASESHAAFLPACRYLSGASLLVPMSLLCLLFSGIATVLFVYIWQAPASCCLHLPALLPAQSPSLSHHLSPWFVDPLSSSLPIAPHYIAGVVSFPSLCTCFFELPCSSIHARLLSSGCPTRPSLHLLKLFAWLLQHLMVSITPSSVRV